jgi:hypothetical protein
VRIEQKPGTKIFHVKGTPSAGFLGLWYIQPSDVSFDGVIIREKHCPAVATGYFLPQNGQDHVPGSDLTIGPTVEGKGCLANGADQIQGGDGGIGPPYSKGDFTWPIPWEFQVGSGAPKQFATVNHVKSIDSAGTLTISKGGTSLSKTLNEASSGY